MKRILFIVLCLILLTGCTESHYIGRDSGNINTDGEYMNYLELKILLKDRCQDICGNHTTNSYGCSCGYCQCYCNSNKGIVC